MGELEQAAPLIDTLASDPSLRGLVQALTLTGGVPFSVITVSVWKPMVAADAPRFVMANHFPLYGVAFVMMSLRTPAPGFVPSKTFKPCGWLWPYAFLMGVVG